MTSRASDSKQGISIAATDGVATRADVLVHRRFPTLSRRQVRHLFATDRVRINGRLARKGVIVSDGDTVVVELSDEAAAVGALPDASLSIGVLFEDSELVALDKPAGIPTLPLRVGERGSVANFLASRYQEVPDFGGAFECGLVHRLDTGTSGVILAARTTAAYQHLRHQFRARRVRKNYLALVHGDLSRAGSVEVPIAHARHNVKRMESHVSRDAATRAKARTAVTRFRPVRRFGHATLVAVCIKTGVRHQIRVHLAWVRHPIVGDDLYAGAATRPVNDVARAARPLLHARRLRFVHPADGRLVQIVAPLPADFRSALTRLSG